MKNLSVNKTVMFVLGNHIYAELDMSAYEGIMASYQ
jgi:hypothetical protein